MPPPPPPSKSYLLVLDTDSEDEDEGSSSYPSPRRLVEETLASPPPSDDPIQFENPTTTGPSPSETSRRRPHIVEDEDDDEDVSAEIQEDDKKEPSAKVDSPTSSSPPLTKNQKKKRARRRKKKKGMATSQDPQSEKQRGVAFSTVSVRSYARCFGQEAVPADGGWPLGLELAHLEARPEVPLEDYEKEKQEQLRRRWDQVQGDKKIDESVGGLLTKSPEGESAALETRQWDYRSKLRNPLFGILSEEERQNLLLEATGSVGMATHAAKGRTRSNSVTSDHNHHHGSPPKRRGRSNSTSASEHFNEIYNQVYVHHVRNELEQLRNERSKSGATGCNCKKLTVYLPPKDGSGGKRAQHRRLKPSKVAQELKKRGMYDASASRDELEKKLHDIVEKEPCCRGDDCFCFRNGIDCQADACSCWHDSHVHTKSQKDGKFLSIKEIQARCGNPLGMEAVDVDAIDEFRTNILNSVVCQPVGNP